MKTLFRPAVWLMNRLSYPAKNLLMGTLASCAVLFLLVSLYSAMSDVITYSRGELEGLANIRQTATLIRALQIHRGASTAVLSGNVGLETARAKQEQALADLTPKLDALFTAHPGPSNTAWKKVKTQWESVHAHWTQSTPSDNFITHTKLIEDALTLQLTASDEMGLLLDPDSDSYYLIDIMVNKTPTILEALGQSRAKGTAILTKKEISDAQKIEISTLLANVDAEMRLFRFGMERVQAGDPRLGKAKTILTSAVDEATGVIRKDVLSGAFGTEPKAYFDLLTRTIDTGYAQIFDVMQPHAEHLIRQRIAKNQRIIALNLSGVMFFLGIAGWLWLGAYIAMIEQMRAFSNGAQEMAQGNLTHRIARASQDELGTLVDRFNTMANAFADLIRKTRDSADLVSEASREIAQSTAQIAQVASKQSDGASSIAASVQQITVGIHHISAHADEAGRTVTEAGRISDAGAAQVGAVVGGIANLEAQVTQAASVVDTLRGHSENISKVVGVIRDVADQTNLLALNAAIEAARAGEHGRGFAVVADEVRTLAERTAKSTAEISALIAAIQSGTLAAVSAMHAGVAGVAESRTLTERAGDSMQSIRSGAEQVNRVVGDISAALREQNSAITDIAQRVEQIAQMAEKTTASVSTNAETARHLEGLAQSLQEEIRRFKL